MAVELLSYSQASTNGTASEVVVGSPSGVAIGDLLIIFAGNENATSGEGFGPVTGFTQLGNWGSGDQDCYLGLYWKIADASDLSTTYTVPFLGNDDGFASVLRFTGYVNTAPVNIIQDTGSVGSTSPSMQWNGSKLGDMCMAFTVFDGSDGDPMTINTPVTVPLTYFESPDPSDAGGAASGAFAGNNTIDSVINYNWGYAASDGNYSVSVRINSPIIQSSPASIVSTGTLSCEGFYRPPIPGSASIVNESFFTAAGDFTVFIAGNSSIINAADIIAGQSIIFQMHKEVSGSASLSSIGSLLLSGHIEHRGQAHLTATSKLFGGTFGKANLTSSSSLTCYGINKALHKGACSIINSRELSISGTVYDSPRVYIASGSSVSMIGDYYYPLASQANLLEARIAAIEQAVNNVPTGTNFLKAEDLEAFYKRDEGVIHGL